MTGKQVPGYKLDVDRDVYSSPEYENWTVADLQEILDRHPADTPVFVYKDDGTVRPVEAVTGTKDSVFL